jgi:hypothetical protein
VSVDRRAVAPLLRVVAFTAVALALVGAALEAGDDSILVPRPEAVAESFVRALAGHHAGAAWSELAPDVQREVSPGELAALARRIAASGNGIAEATGLPAASEGRFAVAPVLVRTERRVERSFQLTLRREHGLWRVASFAALEELAA